MLNCLLCRAPHKWWNCKHKGELDDLQKRLSSLSIVVSLEEIQEPRDGDEEEQPQTLDVAYMMFAMGKESPKIKEA